MKQTNASSTKSAMAWLLATPPRAPLQDTFPSGWEGCWLPAASPSLELNWLKEPPCPRSYLLGPASIQWWVRCRNIKTWPLQSNGIILKSHRASECPTVSSLPSNFSLYSILFPSPHRRWSRKHSLINSWVLISISESAFQGSPTCDNKFY